MSPQSPGYLFVCGCPRSGTTALFQMLASHPRIALGLERYHHLSLAGSGTGLRPGLFSKERFFDIRPGDTFYSSATVPEAFTGYYGELERRYAAARWVGDKTPQLYTVLDHIDDTFPRAHIVAIVRDPLSVASSYQARAANELDEHWGAARDYRTAIVEWNTATRCLLDFAHRRGRKSGLTIVAYDDVFRDGADVAALFMALDLDLPEEVRSACSAIIEEAGRLRASTSSVLTAAQASVVAGAVDGQSGDALLRRRLLL